MRGFRTTSTSIHAHAVNVKNGTYIIMSKKVTFFILEIPVVSVCNWTVGLPNCLVFTKLSKYCIP